MIEEIKIDRLEELIQEMMKKIRDTYPTESREGNPITFDNGAAAPLVKCITEIHGSQSGSGTPSPENVRPIVAYNQSTISVGGRNLWSFGDLTTGTEAGLSLSLKSGSYTFQCVSNTNVDGITIRFNYEDSTSEVITIYRADFSGKSFTLSKNVTTINYNIANFTTGTIISKIQLERGDTAHAYEEYITPIDHTATFSNSIYQGNADLVTGKVTAEWGYIASYDGETLPGLWISDRDEYAAGTTPTTGAQVAYELESPTTITETVSNAPISSIHGYNYIESSTGEMELTYITEEFEALANVPVES